MILPEVQLVEAHDVLGPDPLDVLRAVGEPAAAAYAFITGKTAGFYDHAAGKHPRIAAEAQGEHLQGYDGERL
ncbi:hypothetical protein [Sphingomonas sp. SRS2]|uniref:hypothetical protein n=1 Tax=Sphingomonas sp. SRS2 TaxID=133190 RepID=UPI000698E450|nr:hypothetical protein [Sphingomonas sp. SRS2]